MTDSASQREQAIRRFQETHGVSDLDPADFALALTHRSYAFEQNIRQDNERLEFLGDAVIGLITSEFLYETEQEASEGALSKRRARLVSRALLGRRALDMGLGEFMLLGKGERETGGARRRSTLGSALEALVGIIHLRLGFERAREFVRNDILAGLQDLSAHEAAMGDFKSELQEWAQRNLKVVPQYRRIGEEGPDHRKRFLVQVEVAGRVLAQASGSRVKTAENEAARTALEQIRSDAIAGA